MSIDLINNDDFFEFEIKDSIINIYFNFNSKFKIIDQNGYKLFLYKIYKRSLSKKNFEILEKLIEKKFPLIINEISGLEIENFNINKIYDGVFEIIIYDDNNFDLYLGDLINK